MRIKILIYEIVYVKIAKPYCLKMMPTYHGLLTVWLVDWEDVRLMIVVLIRKLFPDRVVGC